MRRQRLAFWMGLVWLGLGILWALSFPPHCTSYSPRYTQIVDYGQVLATHSSPAGILSNPLVVFVLFNFVGVLLILVARRRWLLAILLPLTNVVSCYLLFVSNFCDGTTLKHLETVEFDGRTYHLASGTDVGGGMDVVTDVLFLHECETGRTICRGRLIGQTVWSERPFEDTSLEVNEQGTQLQVRFRDDIILTQDMRIIPNVVEAGRLAKITPDNIGKIDELLQLHYGAARDLAWTPDGRTLVTNGSAGVWIHRFDEQKIATTPLTATDIRFFLSSIAINPDGTILAGTNGLEGPLYLWDVQTGEEVATVPISYPGDVQFDPVNNTLVMGKNDKLTLLDLDTLSERILWDETLSFYTFFFSSDGEFLAAGGYDHSDEEGRGFVRVWETDSGEEVLFVRQQHLESPEQVVFSPVSDLLAYPIRIDHDPDYWETAYENRVRLWDAETQSEVMVLPFPDATFEVTGLAFSPDGRLLVTVDRDKENNHLRIWDVATGAMLTTMSRPGGQINTVAFRPDGKLITTTGYDDAVRLWGILAGDQ